MIREQSALQNTQLCKCSLFGKYLLIGIDRILNPICNLNVSQNTDKISFCQIYRFLSENSYFLNKTLVIFVSYVIQKTIIY